MTNGKELFIDGKKILCGWESLNGWFWFATKKVGEQLSDMGDGKPVPDIIWFGYVQGFEEEWGYFSQAEIESQWPKTWEISKKNLPYAGRRKC